MHTPQSYGGGLRHGFLLGNPQSAGGRLPAGIRQLVQPSVRRQRRPISDEERRRMSEVSRARSTRTSSLAKATAGVLLRDTGDPFMAMAIRRLIGSLVSSKKEYRASTATLGSLVDKMISLRMLPAHGAPQMVASMGRAAMCALASEGGRELAAMRGLGIHQQVPRPQVPATMQAMLPSKWDAAVLVAISNAATGKRGGGLAPQLRPLAKIGAAMRGGSVGVYSLLYFVRAMVGGIETITRADRSGTTTYTFKLMNRGQSTFEGDPTLALRLIGRAAAEAIGKCSRVPLPFTPREGIAMLKSGSRAESLQKRAKKAAARSMRALKVRMGRVKKTTAAERYASRVARVAQDQERYYGTVGFVRPTLAEQGEVDARADVLRDMFQPDPAAASAAVGMDEAADVNRRRPAGEAAGDRAAKQARLDGAGMPFGGMPYGDGHFTRRY